LFLWILFTIIVVIKKIFNMKTYYWYLVSSQDIYTDDNGRQKKQKKTNLFKAVSVTDAETQAIAQLSNMSDDFRILSVTESKIEQVFFPEGIEIND